MLTPRSSMKVIERIPQVEEETLVYTRCLFLLPLGHTFDFVYVAEHSRNTF